ncbi:MAG TPA: glycoside hydrolase family 38 C-terminal domain-containing protein [Acidimicrobiales bacterium]|nr:glycoside hydrolase family 38 C-terminal domain-containing protein [Acidimicrobiales bacterium]
MTTTTEDVSPGQSTKRRVHVVPHTHWDREWYQSFQTFRLRLVDLLDRLIPQMENDPAYARFLLDGQLAVVDDYLAVRPEAEESLRRLVGSGRISIGPWYTLPDEFLVSGETLVRNLQRGLRVADRFGGAMPVGYLPDMFGHVAQMPQVLAGFGLEHAVVWRGVPAAIDRSGFWWQAPDGSTVRAEYLPQGYGNGSALPDDAKAFVAALDGFGRQWGELLVGPLLWMNGTDHQMPQPWLGRVVAEANALQGDLDLQIVSLPEHLANAPTEGLPTWRGELRAGARANVLMGVTSNRVDVRQAAARAERAVERLAEPLSALYLPAARWPAALLDEAWRDLILNSAHDSVCACSIDEVCDAVLHRYAEAGDIAEGLADRALAHLAARVRHDGPLIVNPTSRPRGGVIRLSLAAAEAPPGTQLLRSRPAESVLLEGPPELVVPAAEELEWMRTITGFSLESAAGAVLVSARREGSGSLVSPDTRVALARLADAGPVRLRVRQPAQVTVLAYVDDVAGFGWRGWTAGGAGTGVEAVTVVEGTAAGGPTLANGLVTVIVDPEDGTYGIDDHAGLGRLVDGGDCGDTYNWCPPARDTVVDRPESVDVVALERGPLRAQVRITARYRWPARAEGLETRSGEVVHEVVTRLELRAGERALRVETTIDNRSRDHRLRTHFPLPTPAASSRAETAFGTVERGLDAEGGPTEAPLPTYPALRFVQAGGLTVVHDGVAEYELVDIHAGRAHELALTLLRCTGMLSQVPMPTRPLPAGPLVRMEGPQLQKRVTRRYAVAVGDMDPFALADEVLVPLQVVQPPDAPAAGDADLPAAGAALAVEGAAVSAVVREGGALTLRVFNPRDEPAAVTIEGRRGWLVDLRGRPVAPFEGSFTLGPWEITTAALAD